MTHPPSLCVTSFTVWHHGRRPYHGYGRLPQCVCHADAGGLQVCHPVLGRQGGRPINYNGNEGDADDDDSGGGGDWMDMYASVV